MKHINRKMLFTEAWIAARKAAKCFGGKAQQYFSLCLQNEYALHSEKLKTYMKQATDTFTAMIQATPVKKQHRRKSTYTRLGTHVDPIYKTTGRRQP